MPAVTMLWYHSSSIDWSKQEIICSNFFVSFIYSFHAFTPQTRWSWVTRLNVVHVLCMTICLWIAFESKVEKNWRMITTVVSQNHGKTFSTWISLYLKTEKLSRCSFSESSETKKAATITQTLYFVCSSNRILKKSFRKMNPIILSIHLDSPFRS